AEFDIDGPEPAVVGREEIVLGCPRRRAAPLQAELVHPASDNIANEYLALIGSRKMISSVISDAGNGRRIGIRTHHLRRVAETIVRLAEAVIVTATQQHHDRLCVAIRRK